MIKIVFLFVVMLTMFPSFLLAQETLIFEDNFTINSNNWLVKNDKQTYLSVSNGKYVFEFKLRKKSYLSWKKIFVDSNKDFAISCNTTWIRGVDSYFYGLAWGISNVKNYYIFGISANGHYVYAISNLGVLSALIKWTKSAYINKRGTNKLAIKKNGSIIEFYINEQKVDQYRFDDFFDDYIGFTVENKQKVLFDDLKASYINNLNANIVEQHTPVINTYNPKLKNEKRLALVIGNSIYGGGQTLKNPVNDANLMTSTLQRLGFTVIKRINATEQSMEQAIREFSRELPKYNVTLFYYAGHGVQVDGTNYIIPVDATLNEKSDCKYEAISINFVVEEFEKYPNNVNIVILDACRNNPFRSWARGGERGFKAITPTSGLIISFATSEGATALDGTGNYGLFTEELVKQMTLPQPIERVFKQTRVEVYKRSNGQQNPMEWTQLTGDFYFVKE